MTTTTYEAAIVKDTSKLPKIVIPPIKQNSVAAMNNIAVILVIIIGFIVMIFEVFSRLLKLDNRLSDAL